MLRRAQKGVTIHIDPQELRSLKRTILLNKLESLSSESRRMPLLEDLHLDRIIGCLFGTRLSHLHQKGRPTALVP